MNKLSIITINYNNVDGLEKTIQSVVSQTFGNFEYIVIDGDSNDGSKNIIQKYADKITYWVSEKDSGIYNAQNKGIKQAKGEYCLFLNSGDTLYENDIINKVFSSDYSQDILYGELIFEFGNENFQIKKLPDKLSIYYLFHDNIWHPASFIKRELFNRIGLYNEKYQIASDYDFFFNAIIINKASTVYIPFPIAFYDTSGISSNSLNFQKINIERNSIHHTYLCKEEIIYLNNLKKIKNEKIARWLVNKPYMTKFFNRLLKIYLRMKF